MSVKRTFVFAFNLLIFNQSLCQTTNKTPNTTTPAHNFATFKPDSRPKSARQTNESIVNVDEPEISRVSVTETFVSPENKIFVTGKPFVRPATRVYVTEEVFVRPENKVLEAEKIFVKPDVLIPSQELIPIIPVFPPPFPNSSFQRLRSWTHHVCGRDALCDRDDRAWDCPLEYTTCHPCRCDSECLQYGDCCLDAYSSEDIQITAQNMSCVTAATKHLDFSHAKRYFMVGYCPEGEPHVSSDVASSCELNLKDGPVYSPQTGLHYKNKNCARCNGISDYVIWRAQPTCFGLVNFTKIVSPESFLEFSLTDSMCEVHFVPPRNNTPRKCIHDDYNMVSSCPSGRPIDDDHIYCERYFSPVTIERTTYRNIFCASCHGAPLVRRVDFCPRDTLTITTLGAVSQLTIEADDSFNTTSGVLVCRPSEVFDPYQDSCRPLFCAAGKVVWNHDCLDIFPSAFGIGYKLSYKLIPAKPAIFQDVGPDSIISKYEDYWEHLQDMADVAIGDTELVLEHVSRPLFFDTSNSLGRFEVLSITVNSYVVVKGHMPTEKMENILKDFVLGGWHANSDGGLVAFEPTWIPENGDFLKKGHSSIHMHPSGNTSFIKRVHQTWNHITPILPAYTNEPTAYIAVNEIMRCKLIQLNSSEYEGDIETGIKYLGKTLRYGQFVPADADKIRVCSGFSGKRTPLPDALTSDDGNDRTVLSPPDNRSTTLWTVASFIASLIFIFVALILSLLGQSVFFSNRLCWIVFMANLFCGQVLFLSSFALKVEPVTCSVLGAVTHYFWLAAVFWVVLAAVRLNQNPTTFSKDTKLICQPSLWGVGQGIPGLIVAVSIAAHLLSTAGPARLATGYGETMLTHSHVCFLASHLGRILGFLVPTGLVLLLTAILSTKTAFATSSGPGITEDPAKLQLAVTYLKTSLILMFAWAVSFAALETGGAYFWIFFALLNAGVGLFLCVTAVESKIVCRTKAQRYIPRENSDDVFDSVDGKPDLNAVSTITVGKNSF